MLHLLPSFKHWGLLWLALTQAAHATPPDWTAWLKTDPRVSAAQASYQAKLTEADGAWSAYLPTVRGIGSSGTSHASDPLTRDGRKRTHGIEIEQPIPIFGRESARVELARVAVRVEAAEVQRVEQTVLSELLEALVAVDTAKAALALRRQIQANGALQAAAAREAVAGGGLKLTEERQILSRQAQTRAQLARAMADLATAQARLLHLLPLGTQPPASLPGWQDFWKAPFTVQSLEGAALAGAPALLKIRAEAEQAGAEHTLARTEYWPKLSLSYQNTKGSTGGVPSDNQSVFFSLNMPLYEGGSTASRVQSAAFRWTAAQERAAYEERMTRQRVTDAWEHWRAADDMVQAWAESEREEQESVSLVAAQLAVGGTTRFGLLRAQQSQLETQLQGVEYRSQRELALIRLLLEAGALTPGGSPHPIQKKDP